MLPGSQQCQSGHELHIGIGDIVYVYQHCKLTLVYRFRVLNAHNLAKEKMCGMLQESACNVIPNNVITQLRLGTDPFIYKIFE